MSAKKSNSSIIMGAASVGTLSGFPQKYNKKIFADLDRPFVILLLSLLLVSLILFAILASRPVSTTVSEKEVARIQERYARLVLNQPVKKVKKKIKKESVSQSKEKVKSEDSKKVKVDRKKESIQQKEMRKQETASTRQKVRQNIQKELQNSGIFAAITSSEGGGSSLDGAVSDLLGDEDVLGDLNGADISGGSFVNRTVSADVLKSHKGERKSGVGIKKSSVGTVSGSRVAKVGSVDIKSEPPKLKGESAGTGERSQSAINRVVSRQQSRLKKVYEAMLKREPSLGGKLIVKFTILPDGTVTNVSIVKSTTGSTVFDRRILSYIKRWRFGPGASGPVEVVFPFVFSGS